VKKEKIILFSAIGAGLLLIVGLVFFVVLPFNPDFSLKINEKIVTSNKKIDVGFESQKPLLCLQCPESLKVHVAGNENHENSEIKVEYLIKLENLDKSKQIELSNLQEGENTLTIELVGGDQIYDTKEIKVVFDKTQPQIESVQNAKEDTSENNDLIVSTNGENTEVKFNFSEEVQVDLECSEQLAEKCGAGTEELSKNLTINIKSDKVKKDQDYSIDMNLTDEAGNTKDIQIKVLYDGTGPEITRVSESPYNVRDFTSCSKAYTLKLKLSESGTLKLDGEELKYNESSGLYEKTITLGEGIKTFDAEATDANGNVSEKEIKVDGICRTSSVYGPVHPWCLQKALISCGGGSGSGIYNSCVDNYIQTSCSQYH
jgi:hypothetical protein